MFGNVFSKKKDSQSDGNVASKQLNIPQSCETSIDTKALKSRESAADIADNAQDSELAAVIGVALSVFMEKNKQPSGAALRVFPYQTSTAWSMVSRWKV